MKTLLILTVLTVLLTACGNSGGTAASSNTNSTNAATPKTNSSENDPTKSADTSPVSMSLDKMTAQSAESLKEYKGRSFVLKGQLEKWTTDEMEVSFGSNTIKCSGDFAEYREAIDLYAKRAKKVRIDFRGVLEDVNNDNFSNELKLKDCIITNLEK
jgi:hypothetical protein